MSNILFCDEHHAVPGGAAGSVQLPDALTISCAYCEAITISGGQGRDEVQCKQPFCML
jgi:hypothetical protein